ncbi:MAG: hypothetical protein JOZ69_17490, partial [Myxococcales bacterium]|nr:hypothetical protein [Myxococcales bacterium]
MSERFIRCVHCFSPHDAKLASCPTTGRPIPRPRPSPPAFAPGAPSPPGAGAPAAKPRVGPPPLPPRASARHAPCPAPPPPSPSPERALLGTTIASKYLVRAVVGEGGMAVVFDALHLRLGCAVALKVLRA